MNPVRESRILGEIPVDLMTKVQDGLTVRRHMSRSKSERLHLGGLEAQSEGHSWPKQNFGPQS